MTDGILSNLNVIEFSSGMSAAICGMQLAEAGAAVTRIVYEEDEQDLRAVSAAVWHRSKNRVVLASGPSSAAQLDELLESADVFVHDFGPVAAGELQLGDKRLTSLFPTLVIASAPAWPVAHPLADAPARETLVMARLGILDEQRSHRPGPCFVRMPMASWCAGWALAMGVVARLIHRQQTGQGGVVHTSLAQGALTTLIQLWARAEKPTPSFTQGMPKTLPWTMFECQDGRWIHLMGNPDVIPTMQSSLSAIGEARVAEANARWPVLGDRFPNAGANAEIFRTRPAQAWLEELWAADIPAQLCAALGDVYFDEQARLNGYVIDVDDPRYGPTLQPGVPIHVDPPSQVHLPPRHVTPRHSIETSTTYPDAGLPRLAPLSGLRVLDFGSFMAGPFGPQCLAELGADVIKIEAVTGDPKRALDRNFAGSCRGKRSVALDLRDPRTRPALAALVQSADIVHHNIRLPAARRLGIDYDSLKRLKPDLIYCHVSAYGPEGPRRYWPGYDQMFQSSCGWEVAGGGEGNAPIWYRFGMMDVLCAMSSAFATELAIFHRQRTGLGQAVTASLLGAGALTAGESLGRPDGSVVPYAQLDSEQMGVSPENRLYICADRWIAVAALRPAEAQAFHALCGSRPESWCRRHSASRALDLLRAAGVPAEAVVRDGMDAFFDDADNREAGLIVTYPRSAWGQMQQIGGLWNFDDLPLNFKYPAPALGEHSIEVLREVGVPESEVERLLKLGLLKDHPRDLTQ